MLTILNCMHPEPHPIWTNLYITTRLSDIKDRTPQNKLKLSEDKTDAMVLGKLSVLSGVGMDVIVVANCQIR